MSSITREAIEERVRIFVDSVRNGVGGFKPGITWWLVTDTITSRTKFPEAFSLLEQLEICENDMKRIFTSYWTTRIGEGTFGDVLRQGKIERSIIIAVRPADEDESNNTSPLNQTSIIVGGANTRLAYPR